MSNGRRVTPDAVEAEIVREGYHVFPGTTLTVACLTLRNGYCVTGEAAAASPENFDASIGREFARKDALAKVWPLLGFRLRDRLAVSD